MPVRTKIRRLIENLTGYRVHKFGTSLGLADTRRPSSAWFSHMVTLRHVIASTDINLVLDVGANEGQFGLNLREQYRGDLISFEPVSSAYAALSATAKGDPRWHTVKCALGSRDETATINVASATKFSSILEANSFSKSRWGAQAAATRTETIEVTRLETILPTIVSDIDRRRILLKMDTQGFDLQVFAGLGIVEKFIFALQSEVSLIRIYEGCPSWIESISSYERAGFGVAGLFPVSWSNGRVIEYDCVMIRAART
ncbi:MAG: FkbM family methyltransferase [Steroidobacteraceae bacterium]